MPKPKKVKLCGQRKARRNRTNPLCERRAPCRYHPADGKPQPTKPPTRGMLRKQKMIQGILGGKTQQQAAVDAGYAESTAKKKSGEIIRSPECQALIRYHTEIAGIHTNEIIGMLVGVMRGDIYDIFPDSPILKRAHENHVSHLVKRVKSKTHTIHPEDGDPIEVVETEVEIYSALDAAKHLTKVFGLEQLPAPNLKAKPDFDAAVERVLQRARDAGIETTREIVEEKLRKHPQFKLLFNEHQVTDAVN